MAILKFTLDVFGENGAWGGDWLPLDPFLLLKASLDFLIILFVF